MHLYLATDLEPAAADGRLGPDEDERLILEWRPVAGGRRRGRARRDPRRQVDRRAALARATAAGARRCTRRAAHAGSAGATPRRCPAGDVSTCRSAKRSRAIVGVARRSTGVRLLGLLTLSISVASRPCRGPVVDRRSRHRAGHDHRLGHRPDSSGGSSASGPISSVRDTTLDPGRRRHRDRRPGQPRGTSPWTTYRMVNDVGGYLVFDIEGGTSMVVPKRAFSPSPAREPCTACSIARASRPGTMRLALAARHLRRVRRSTALVTEAVGLGRRPASWFVPTDGRPARPRRQARERIAVQLRPGLSATASRRCVPASSRRPSRLRLWPSAKCA